MTSLPSSIQEEQCSSAKSIFLGNLNNELPMKELKSLILQFIFKHSGQSISPETVKVKIKYSKLSDCCYAQVCLLEANQLRPLINKLKRAKNPPEDLVKSARNLKVDFFSKNNVPVRLCQSSEEVNQITHPYTDDRPNLSHGCICRIYNEINTFGGSESFPESFYLHQHLGKETRHIEFKRGGGEYLKKHFAKQLGRYASAFLNSEGGTFFVGIDDSGIVHGSACNQKTEDNTRCVIDQVMRHCIPHVDPKMYSVMFVPVMNTEDSDLKVIQIDFKAGSAKILYETPDGEVFIRRDGSIQGPLKAKEIKDWCKSTLEEEFSYKEQLLRIQIEHLTEKLEKVETETHKNVTNAEVSQRPLHTVDSQKLLEPTEMPSKQGKRTNSAICVVL